MRSLGRGWGALIRVVVAMLVGLGCLGLAGAAMADGITNSGDDLRTGWYPNAGQQITPQLVGSNAFGQQWSASVDGQVYAQPLYAPSSAPNGTLIVATENNKVYGLDPATGQQQWMTDLGTPWNPADLDPNCLDIAPSVGTSSTPVIDTSTSTIYLTHKGYDSSPSHNAAWYMDALDLNTGHEKQGWPVQMTTGSGFADNAPITFFPKSQNQRPGLLLMNGVVYAAFGSHCDDPAWQGWVFGVSTAGQIKAKWVDDSIDNGAGIWGGGTGLASDGSGSILFSTGNGAGNVPTNPTPGNSPPPSLEESVVKLQVQANGQLQPVDFFMPLNAASLDTTDGDLGSGGVVVLPDAFFGSGTSVPHLAVVAGKEGRVFLLNRDNLGGFEQGPGQSDEVVQAIGRPNSVYGRPGVWPGDGGYVYVPTTGGEGNATPVPLDVYKYTVTGSGDPSLSLAGSAGAFNWGSGSPVITSDGTTSGSALVWIIYAADRKGDGGVLQAYDAVPTGGQLNLRFSAPIGRATGYSIPGVGGGRLYVGTRDGKILAFGRLPGHLETPTGAIDFGAVQAGTTASQTFAVSNTGGTTVTITGSQPPSGGGFTATTSLPQGATIAPGQTVTETVTFTPTGSGPATGAWQITADDGSGPHQVQFTGTGTAGPPPAVKIPRAPRFSSAVATTPRLRGIYISYDAVSAGVSRFVLQRATVGRRGAHGCVGVTARNRSRPRCTRYVVVATFAHRDRVGANRLRLGAYVPLRKLLPGSYRLQSILLDSAGARHTFYTQLRVITPPHRQHARHAVLAPLGGLFVRFAAFLRPAL